MSEIFQKLGLAPDAGAEEITRKIVCARCPYRLECIDSGDAVLENCRLMVECLTAFAARERKGVWDAFAPLCRYCDDGETCGCDGGSYCLMEYCPLLRGEEGE